MNDGSKDVAKTFKNKYEYERSQVLGTAYETIEEVEEDA
jgi:hypothetical protein